ncbi:MAG: hypothetical protein H0U85_09695, partial [Gemmatimonadales bacterium]|nr:hypothetical protein [Gemmatimonadales bacterium]
MIRKALAVALWIATAATAPAAAQAPKPAQVAASVRRLFGRDVRIDTLRADSSLVLRVSRRDSLLGFARVGNVRGKDQPITWLVAVDPALRLRDVDIL